MSFELGAKVHIIGIGGAGMSGLALLLAEKGCVVSGSDATDSPALADLARAGVTTYVGHDAAHVDPRATVLWSPAVGVDNVELEAASRQGARMLQRSEVLAELAVAQRVIGITGTHGKTTATSMLVHVMRAGGRDDSRLLGAAVTGVGANGHYGRDDLLLEVDESYGTFSRLTPGALGVLNVEADHLDHYGDVATLERAFAALVERTTGEVVAWVDDPGAARVCANARRDVTRVGTDGSCLWRVGDVVLGRRNASFTLAGLGESLSLELRVTGRHNVANASVAAVLAITEGVAPHDVGRGLMNFEGAPRRFQFLGSWRGVDVYEDYAHLPGEVAATLEATRAAGYERIVAVFQPHRVTRTLNLASAFGPSFNGASHVVVTDIYRAGEANPDNVSGELVAYAASEGSDAATVTYAADFEDVIAQLELLHDRGDVVLLLGAGDIAQVAARLDGGLRP